jgi:asparagine synthase (glutamine-hydrolysing)
MCGIAGICLTDPQREVDKGLLAAMTERLAHRGPDGSGFHIGPQIGLGHRRLSIIDLAGGDQPIYNEDGSIAIVFNGRSTTSRNYAVSLRQRAPPGNRVGHRGHRPLYEDLGASCRRSPQRHVCFAIWDARRRRLSRRAIVSVNAPLLLARLRATPVCERAQGDPDGPHGTPRDRPSRSRRLFRLRVYRGAKDDLQGRPQATRC